MSSTSNKTKKIKFILYILFKSQVPPRIPPTMYLFQPGLRPPHIFTNIYNSSVTNNIPLPLKNVHRYKMGIKKYKMIEPPMGVVTVPLPTSDTKKVLVVLLHVPVQRIKIVRRKCTEGAQQSLLCVHTSNVGIHP